MTNNDFDIAIIGMSCEFPNSKDKHQYWHNIRDGIECLSDLSQDELKAAGVAQADLAKENYVSRAGVLEDIEDFAAGFFGLSPREAELMDPQHRRFLEHAWWAIEDAGIDPYTTDKVIGLYAGASLNAYLINNLLTHAELKGADHGQQLLFGNSHDYLATRVAHFMDLKGPAITMQTACSSSLVIVHQACQALLTQQADVMLAGGVTIRVPQKSGYLYSIDGILAKDGHCKAFDNDASGTLFTNGIGVIVMKRLADALADGDDIYAVIKGSAVNNDGSNKVSYTAPNVDGQAEVIALAHAVANVDPDTISYIEAHGTGTHIGDPIEISALNKAFQVSTKRKQFCAIGSVKSNIGHLDIAAGIAGLIKTVLALRAQQLPPSLHFTEANPKLKLNETAFYVNTKLQPWQSTNGLPRRAAVSSFGIGGTNAHVILEQAPVPEEVTPVKQADYYLFPLSAKTEQELILLCQHYADYIEQYQDINLLDLSSTLQLGRHHFPYRRVLLCANVSELIDNLRANFKPQLCQQALEKVIITKQFATLTKGELQTLGEQWLRGHNVIWQDLYLDSKCVRLHLPNYPFNRQRYWVEPNNSEYRTEKKINDINQWFYLPSYKQSLSNIFNEQQFAEGSLVFVREQSFAEQLGDELECYSKHTVRVYPGTKFERLAADKYRIDPENYQHYEDLLTALKAEGINLTHIIHGWTLREQMLDTPELSQFYQVQQVGLFSISRVVLAMQKIFHDTPLQFTIISNYVNAITSDEKTDPNQATLNALPKIIPKEFANIKMQLLDLGEPTAHKGLVKTVLAEVAKANYDQDEIVFRHQQRWLREYTQIQVGPCQTDRPQYLSPGNVIMITGGLGQMGLDIADYFAKVGDLKLALLTRSAFLDEDKWDQWLQDNPADDPISEKITRVRKLRKAGLSVIIKKADVSNKSSLDKAVREIREEFCAIHGVIHAAGDTGNGIVAVQDPKAVEKYYPAFSAKVDGSYNLADIFQGSELEFMVLCSSMNAIIGGLGQIENTVVNVFIDHFAEYIGQHASFPVLAINWGAVNFSRPPKINVLPQFLELSTEHKKNYMDDSETYEVYNRLLNHMMGPRLLISTVDMEDVLYNWNRVAAIDELAKDHTHAEVKSLAGKGKVPESDVASFIANCWQTILGVENVHLDDNFFDLGGHSLAAVQIVNKMAEQYNVKTHVMNLFELPCLKDFANHIEKLNRERNAKLAVEAVNA